jgi:hypothetical protein
VDRDTFSQQLGQDLLDLTISAEYDQVYIESGISESPREIGSDPVAAAAAERMQDEADAYGAPSDAIS